MFLEMTHFLHEYEHTSTYELDEYWVWTHWVWVLTHLWHVSYAPFRLDVDCDITGVQWASPHNAT